MNKVLLIIGIFTLLITTGVAQDKGINKAIKELDNIGQEHRSKEWFSGKGKSNPSVKGSTQSAGHGPYPHQRERVMQC
ncbi:MAG: hypothetical protein COB36_11765 [Alphaproteobacteria bacterium]|nr:MAG: hypothetical protein COB36_11765 [Alphaproteobacteria bacterium]